MPFLLSLLVVLMVVLYIIQTVLYKSAGWWHVFLLTIPVFSIGYLIIEDYPGRTSQPDSAITQLIIFALLSCITYLVAIFTALRTKARYGKAYSPFE